MRIESNTNFGYNSQSNAQQVVTKTPDTNSRPEAVKEVSTPEKSSGQETDSRRDLANKPKYELTLDEKTIIDVIEKANRAFVGNTCSFEFSIHEKTNAIMVKVINKETKELIREIPPEKILDLVAKMWELAGIIVDERR